MKKVILIIFLINIIPFKVKSQTNQATLDYDFAKGDFDKKISPVPTGQFVTLKIKNINTFRYKVEIEGTNINYVTQIPSELQTLFRLSDQSSIASKAKDGLENVQKAAAQMIDLKETIVNKNKDAATPVGVAAVAAAKSDQKLEEAMNNLVEACKKYVAVAQSVASIKFTRAELINASKQKWKSHADMKLPKELLESDMRNNYNLFVTYYAKAYSLYNTAKLAAIAANDNDAKKTIEEAESNFENGRDNIYEDNFLKLIEDVLVLQVAVQNPDYFEVFSPPIQVDGDFVRFSVKITPAQVNDLMPYESAKTFPFEIPAKGGLKVDFSVGPTFSFGNNSRDNQYYLESQVKTDSVKIRGRDNNNMVSPGLAAMMHFYKRSGKNYAIGGLFGVGAGFQSVQDVNFNFIVGLSCVLGKQEKIMINAGVSYLKVDRLKTNQFVEDKNYLASKIDIGNITEKVFKPSFFLSVSYNLTNKVEVK